MTPFLRKLGEPRIWQRIFTERLTEPLHLNAISAGVALAGTFRAKVAWDLVLRQYNAFALLRAADYCQRLGLRSCTAVEFGVASGAGLINMCEVARRVTDATGVRFEIVGFDSGEGMPPPRDYRDHPEYYREADFPMDRRRLEAALPGNARLVIGDIASTVGPFLAALPTTSPIGYVDLDVDYYSSAVDALRLFTGEPEQYLPTTLLYLDDIAFDGHNPWCGELAAVAEFNAANELRKVNPFPALRQKRIFKNASWIDHVYVVNVLDHPTRNRASAAARQVLANPYLP